MGAPEITHGAVSKCFQNKEASPEAQGLPFSLESPGPAETQLGAVVRSMHEIDLGLTMESESFPTSL